MSDHCSASGMPMRTALQVILRLNAKCSLFSLKYGLQRIAYVRQPTPEMNCAITVASAAPKTPM